MTRLVCAGNRRHSLKILLLALVALATLCESPWAALPASAAPATPLVQIQPAGAYIYVAQPGQPRLSRTRRDGTTLASVALAGPPAALALDSPHHLLYVALVAGHGIEVIREADLRPIAMLPVRYAVSGLAVAPAHNALYLVGTAHRALYLTYKASGAVRVTPVTREITQPAEPQIDVWLASRTASRSYAATFWADGFIPGETVLVSWGASSRGATTAGRFGFVTGTLASMTVTGGQHGVSLYGRTSHLALVQAITISRPRHTMPHRPSLPPLYLAMLPGAIATVTPPLLKHAVRIPVSAAALPALPIAGVLMLMMRARGKRKQPAKRGKRKRK